MKPTYYLMLLALLITSCAPIKKLGSPQNFIPSIGTIGKEQKSLLNRNFEQIGKPNIKEGIGLSVREKQFTKSKFKSYFNYKVGKGEKLKIAYSDSLKMKPKYMHLEISNKIALQSQLNEAHNDEVRSYLAHDEKIQIVSEISFISNSVIREKILKADALFLSESANGTLVMKILKANNSTLVNFANLEVFDYRLSGFCWKKNGYGKTRIETLNGNGNCPEGMEKNPKKLEDTKSYIKL